MDANLFWTIIDSTRERASDTTTHARALFGALEAMPTEQVLGFHTQLAAAHTGLYSQQLWSAGSYALGPMSEDVFADLRTHLIGQGRCCVRQVIVDVDTLAQYLPADTTDIAGSQLLIEAASAAYEEVAGAPLEQTRPDLAAADFPDGPPRGWPITQDELATQLPELTARFHRSRRWSWQR